MSLLANRYEHVITPRKPKIAPKLNRNQHKTLVLHLEKFAGEFRIIDLTSKSTESPRVVASYTAREISNDDFFWSLIAKIRSYQKRGKFTKVTLDNVWNKYLN